MKKERGKLFLLVPVVFLLVLFGWAGGARAGVAQVAAGDYYTVVLKTDGSLWAWGENEYGQLGDETTVSKSRPVRIGTENDWQTVAAGYYHAFAIKTDGTLWAWGANWSGQLGDGTTTDKNSPVQIGTENDWQTVAAGVSHAVAVKIDGSLWAWGKNNYGQLGDETTVSKSSPVRVGTENDWQTVAAGQYYTFALKMDGSLWAWGDNGKSCGEEKGCEGGQLGDETTINRNSPVQIGTENDWQVAAAGDYHTVALKTGGTLWAWGENGEGWQGWEESDWDGWEGQLGDGTTVNRTSPVQIGTENDWQIVDAGPHHTIAVKTDGSLWAWGANWRGQLGDGTTVRKKSPVQIGTENDWQDVAVGYAHTVALKRDGTFWTWGDNWAGQLGDGTTTDKNIPVQIEIEANGYTVTPSAGTGGSISPNTPQSVEYGKTASFEIAPSTGYAIDKVEGCGGTLNGSTYTTGAITADCTVTANFVINKYTVTPSAGEHGSISPDTEQIVEHGQTIDFEVTPATGYSIDKVEGCGGTLNGSTYTTGAITADCAVTATFVSSTTYTVTPRTGRHGSISPSVPQTVHEDRTVSFTVTPDTGWQIKRVLGCGGTLNGSAYTTGPVRRDCTVRASFDRK